MMARRALPLLLCWALVVACADPGVAALQSTAGEHVRAPGALDRFSEGRSMRHVRRLARGIGPRVRATRGERTGARYVATKLRAYGYRVKVPTFAVDGARSRNVVARWPGGNKHAVVIGAHIDTVRGSPGANDNASGVAVMIELARIFAGRRQAGFVRFIGFGAEEYGTDGRHHVGSQTYVNRIGERGRRRLAGMISVDMIADGRPLIIGTAGIGPRVVARTMVRKLRKAGIAAVYRTTCDCSDNGPFERAGIPAAFVWSGSERDWHSPSDTVANMSRRDLVRTGRAMRFFVRSLDRKLIRRFRARR
jgi:Iap family predicted aminopeptidase